MVDGVCLGIPIVKAASTIVVLASRDHVHRLRLVAYRDAIRLFLPISHGTLEEGCIDWVAPNHELFLGGIDFMVEDPGCSTRRAREEMIALWRLVNDLVNRAP